MVTSRASTHACVMNCSMEKSSTRCERPKSLSRAGGATSTRSGRTNRSATSHQRQRYSSQHSPRGRLRYAERLRRPRWRNDKLSTNIPPGPLRGGRSIHAQESREAADQKAKAIVEDLRASKMSTAADLVE